MMIKYYSYHPKNQFGIQVDRIRGMQEQTAADRMRGLKEKVSLSRYMDNKQNIQEEE